MNAYLAVAKIKLKFGENEIEIDSRDFYVDNETLGEIINKLSGHIEENYSRFSANKPKIKNIEENEISEQSREYMNTLEDAEVHEPEYSPPVPIIAEEIVDKIKILEKNAFFEQPRTVLETVSQMREYGWAASPLQVSKVLAQMAFNREILKNSYQNRSYYVSKKSVLAT